MQRSCLLRARDAGGRKPSGVFQLDCGWAITDLPWALAFFFAIYVALTLFRILLRSKNALLTSAGAFVVPRKVFAVEP